MVRTASINHLSPTPSRAIRYRLDRVLGQARDEIVNYESVIERSQKQLSTQAEELRRLHDHVQSLERTHTSWKFDYERQIESLRSQLAAQSQPLAQPTILRHIDIDQLAPRFKTTGNAWNVVYNPTVGRTLDVKLLCTIPQDSYVCSVGFGSSSSNILAIGSDQVINVYDALQGTKLYSLEDKRYHRDTIEGCFFRCVCFSPDGQYLAAGSEDAIVRVWDTSTRTIYRRFEGHEREVYSLVFALDGRTIISGSIDGTVRQWGWHQSTAMHTVSIEDGVTSLALSADGKFLAAGSYDSSVYLWNVSNWSPIGRLGGLSNIVHTDAVYSVAFLPYSNMVASASLDKTVALWEMRQDSTTEGSPNSTKIGQASTAGTTKKLEGHSDFVLGIATTSDGRYVLSGSKDQTAHIWDAASCEPLAMLRGHENSIIDIATSRGTQYFATASGDKTAKVWSLY